MRTFFAQLLAKDETAIDAVAFAGLLALVALIAFEGVDVLVQHHEFGALNFSTAAGSLIAAIAGGKRWRDGKGDQPPPPGGQ